MPREKSPSVKNVMDTRFEWEFPTVSNSLISDLCFLPRNEHGTLVQIQKKNVTNGFSQLITFWRNQPLRLINTLKRSGNHIPVVLATSLLVQLLRLHFLGGKNSVYESHVHLNHGNFFYCYRFQMEKCIINTFCIYSMQKVRRIVIKVGIECKF